MKKILLMLFMLIGFSISSYAQSVQVYRATSFAYKSTDYYGNWSNWSDWQRSSVKIEFNLPNDVIVIHSPVVQAFGIYDTFTPPYDSGGTQVGFVAVDAEGVRCHIRLRIEHNGNSQIYIEYSNLLYVYNVTRIQ